MRTNVFRRTGLRNRLRAKRVPSQAHLSSEGVQGGLGWTVVQKGIAQPPRDGSESRKVALLELVAG